MNNKPVIVIGNDHENTLNVIRSLGKANYDVILFLITNTTKTFSNKSKYVSKYLPLDSVEKVVDYLCTHLFFEARVPILTTSDSASAVLDYYRESLEPHYFIPNCHNISGGIKNEMDKRRMCQTAIRSGFRIPKTIATSPTTFLEDNVSTFEFPVILKPLESIGGSKDDFRICENIIQLKEAVSSSQLQNALIQEYISNDEVLVVSGVRTLDKKNHIFGYINKLKHGKYHNNLGLNAMGVYINMPLLHQECSKFLESIEYVGPYSFDFVRNNDKLYFMEINLRTDGLLFFYDEAGINIPAIWADSCYGELFNRHIKPKNKKIIGINEFQYIKNHISYRYFFENIKDLLSANRFAILSMRDIKPMIFKIINH